MAGVALPLRAVCGADGARADRAGLDFEHMPVRSVSDADREQMFAVWEGAFGHFGADWSTLLAGDYGVGVIRHRHGQQRIVAACLTCAQDVDTAAASLYLFGFGAHPRGHGHGSHLMDRIKHACASSRRHYACITLRVDLPDKGEMRFYVRHGFSVTAAPASDDADVEMTFPVVNVTSR